jgi:dephospho-CoA kinase
MLIIGLAGGIASGKSFVAACFEQLGASLIDADKVGHIVLDQSEVQSLLVSRWGPDLIKDNKVDRHRLSEIVFRSDGDVKQLAELEKITHPRIRQRIESQIEILRGSGRVPAVVLDAPVMFRAGWDDVCDKIVFVDAPLQVRKQRAASRRWDEGELELRESRQVAIEEKRKRSTCVVDNSGSEQDTRDQIELLWRQWKLPHK